MTILDLALGLTALVLGLRAAIRLLGPPWTAEGLRRWSFALLVVAVVLAGRKELATILAETPRDVNHGLSLNSPRDIVLGLALSFVTFWGAYRLLLRREQKRDDRARRERGRELPRRRVLPPPPQ